MRIIFKIVVFSALIVFLLFFQQPLKAQDNRNDTIKVYAFIVDGDTIPGGRMLDVNVQTVMLEKWRDYWANWSRLRNAVYVTYPYAMAAGKVMNEVNAMLVNVTDKNERKRIIKSREKDLKREFADKLTNLSVYQGKVLMKLIYRETGNNCYNLIQEYKGGFTAGLWQTIAVVFGSNLKQNYDPADKDRAVEVIVQDVEKMYGRRS